MPFAVGSVAFRCQSCGTMQKVSKAEKGMSARICIKVAEEDVWLSILTTKMESLLTISGTESTTTTEKIAEALLGVEKIKIKYNTRSKVVIAVSQYDK